MRPNFPTSDTRLQYPPGSLFFMNSHNIIKPKINSPLITKFNTYGNPKLTFIKIKPFIKYFSYPHKTIYYYTSLQFQRLDNAADPSTETHIKQMYRMVILSRTRNDDFEFI